MKVKPTNGKITLLRADGWCGLYVNDRLVYQHDDLEVEDLFSCVDLGVELVQGYAYIEVGQRLPDDLRDVVYAHPATGRPLGEGYRLVLAGDVDEYQAWCDHRPPGDPPYFAGSEDQQVVAATSVEVTGSFWERRDAATVWEYARRCLQLGQKHRARS